MVKTIKRQSRLSSYFGKGLKKENDSRPAVKVENELQAMTLEMKEYIVFSKFSVKSVLKFILLLAK